MKIDAWHGRRQGGAQPGGGRLTSRLRPESTSRHTRRNIERPCTREQRERVGNDHRMNGMPVDVRGVLPRETLRSGPAAKTRGRAGETSGFTNRTRIELQTRVRFSCRSSPPQFTAAHTERVFSQSEYAG